MHSTGYLWTFTSEHVLLHLKSALQSTVSLVILPLRWRLHWTSKEKDLWTRGGWSHQGEGSCTDHCDSTRSFVNKIKTWVLLAVIPPEHRPGQAWAQVGSEGARGDTRQLWELTERDSHTDKYWILSSWMCNSQRDTCPSFYSTLILQMALQILPHSSAIIISIH